MLSQLIWPVFFFFIELFLGLFSNVLWKTSCPAYLKLTYLMFTTFSEADFLLLLRIVIYTFTIRYLWHCSAIHLVLSYSKRVTPFEAFFQEFLLNF